MSSSSTGPRCFSSSALICGQRLPQLPLFAIGLTMILDFTAHPRSRRQSRQLAVGGGLKQPESELFADATNAAAALWKLASFGQRRRVRLRKERDLLGLAHAPDRRQRVVGRRDRLSQHAARDEARAE